jgi:hypothetical protein
LAVSLGSLEEVKVAMQKDRLIICRAQRPREGWEEAFRSMAEHRDDLFGLHATGLVGNLVMATVGAIVLIALLHVGKRA